ncbi:hypothetical protein P5V15_014687 [Pogonomyrmex californicus]
MKKEEHQQGFKKYCPPTYIDQEDDNRIMIPGEWRRDAAANIQNLHRIGANRAAVAAVNLIHLPIILPTTKKVKFLGKECCFPWL